MTLVQMRYFIEVCKYRNITKAAEKLHISQPAVTVAMKELESETGLNLFKRQGRRFSLTEDAEFLLSKIEPIVNDSINLENDISDYINTKNHIKLAVPLQIGSFLIPLILGPFKQVYPEIKLDIVELGGLDSLALVEREELDLAISVYEKDFSDNILCTHLFDEEYCFCTYETHPLAEKPFITVADLIAEPLILLQGGFFINQMILREFDQCGIAPNILLSSAQLHTVKSLVASKVGSTFLMKAALKPSDGLITIPFKPPFYVSAGIITKKNRNVYKDVQTLINFVYDYYITKKNNQ